MKMHQRDNHYGTLFCSMHKTTKAVSGKFPSGNMQQLFFVALTIYKSSRQTVQIQNAFPT
jgi:hypothetical protein